MFTLPLPGVYAIRAINSRLIYVGASKNLQQRKALHSSNIRKANTEKGCKAIIDAVNNGDIWEFNVLEYCNSYSEREQFWIDFYRNQQELQLVNVFDAKRSGSIPDQDFRDKIGRISAERWQNEEYREMMLERSRATRFTAEARNKEVLQFDLSGNLINRYSSAKEAAIHLGLNKSRLAEAARGAYCGRHQYKGSLFIYKDLILLDPDGLQAAHTETRIINLQAIQLD